MARGPYKGRTEKGKLASLFLWVMVTAILGMAVALPVVIEVIDAAALSGTGSLVLNLLPLFMALLMLVALAAPLVDMTR